MRSLELSEDEVDIVHTWVTVLTLAAKLDPSNFEIDEADLALSKKLTQFLVGQGGN